MKTSVLLLLPPLLLSLLLLRMTASHTTHTVASALMRHHAAAAVTGITMTTGYRRQPALMLTPCPYTSQYRVNVHSPLQR